MASKDERKVLTIQKKKKRKNKKKVCFKKEIHLFQLNAGLP